MWQMARTSRTALSFQIPRQFYAMATGFTNIIQQKSLTRWLLSSAIMPLPYLHHSYFRSLATLNNSNVTQFSTIFSHFLWNFSRKITINVPIIVFSLLFLSLRSGPSVKICQRRSDPRCGSVLGGFWVQGSVYDSDGSVHADNMPSHVVQIRCYETGYNWQRLDEVSRRISPEHGLQRSL